MSSREALSRASAAMLTMMGSMSATVPVLLTNAPMAAVTIITMKNSRVSLPLASFIIRLLTIFASPV